MKKFLVYLRNYKAESVLAPLFKMLEAGFELIVPLVVASIIDNGIANNDVSYIIKKCLILVLLAIVGMVASITAQYFAAKAATGFGTELRHTLFKKIENLTFSDVDKIGTSSLITRITTDVNQIQSGVNLILRLFLRSPFIVFGAMIMAFTVDVKAALVFVVTIPVLSVVVFGIMAYSIPKYRNVQKNLDNITLKTRENLSGARVIRAFTQEENEVADFNEKNNFLSSIQKSTAKITALMNPTTYIIINVAIIVLIYVGGLRVNSGNLSQGQVVALYNYMSQILIELVKLANLIFTVTKAFACGSRVQAVLELNDELIKTDDEKVYSNNSVEFSNVSLKYNGAADYSLKDINFSAEKGNTIGIIGGTGSGKTSVASLISHFYDATDGNVFVDGRNVNSYNADELREKIGYVFQKAVLFKGTVRDNLLFSNKNASEEDMINALKEAQIYDIILEKGGLDAEIKQNGQNLSGGQKQRLTIARALVRKPEILVFDDSASALDFATEAKLRKELYSLSYKPTVFIVSQRASSIMEADNILVLDDGSQVDFAPHSKLLENCEIYKEIYTSQFGEEDENE